MEVKDLSKTLRHNSEDLILIEVLLPHLDIGCRFSRCIGKHGVGIHETATKWTVFYFKTEGAELRKLNTVKQQHTSTATSMLTTYSTYRSLSAQRLSERTVE
jgi:hypothetical protein